VLGKAVEIKERLLGSAHPLLATTLASLADLYLNWGGSMGLEGRDKVRTPTTTAAASPPSSLGPRPAHCGHSALLHSLSAAARCRCPPHRCGALGYTERSVRHGVGRSWSGRGRWRNARWTSAGVRCVRENGRDLPVVSMGSLTQCTVRRCETLRIAIATHTTPPSRPCGARPEEPPPD
jgi:hypothetical protein